MDIWSEKIIMSTKMGGLGKAEKRELRRCSVVLLLLLYARSCGWLVVARRA